MSDQEVLYFLGRDQLDVPSEALPSRPDQMAKFEFVVSLARDWNFGQSYTDDAGRMQRRTLKDFYAYVQHVGTEVSEYNV